MATGHVQQNRKLLDKREIIIRTLVEVLAAHVPACQAIDLLDVDAERARPCSAGRKCLEALPAARGSLKRLQRLRPCECQQKAPSFKADIRYGYQLYPSSLFLVGFVLSPGWFSAFA